MLIIQQLSPNYLRMEDGGDIGMRGGLLKAIRWKLPLLGYLNVVLMPFFYRWVDCRGWISSSRQSWCFDKRVIDIWEGDIFTIRETLLWLKSNHYNHIIVGSDCALVVHALDRSIVDDSKFDCFISDCLMLSNSF